MLYYSSHGEGSVIHWTRQIKELLNAQEAMEQADTAGPLEEIEFWSVRCEDLSGLTTQLDKPGVLRVCKILDKAKSSYLKQFNKLARLIQVSLHVHNSLNSGPHIVNHLWGQSKWYVGGLNLDVGSMVEPRS